MFVSGCSVGVPPISSWPETSPRCPSDALCVCVCVWWSMLRWCSCVCVCEKVCAFMLSVFHQRSFPRTKKNFLREACHPISPPPHPLLRPTLLSSSSSPPPLPHLTCLLLKTDVGHNEGFSPQGCGFSRPRQQHLLHPASQTPDLASIGEC